MLRVENSHSWVGGGNIEGGIKQDTQGKVKKEFGYKNAIKNKNKGFEFSKISSIFEKNIPYHLS